jgi:hypothetical protein
MNCDKEYRTEQKKAWNHHMLICNHNPDKETADASRAKKRITNERHLLKKKLAVLSPAYTVPATKKSDLKNLLIEGGEGLAWPIQKHRALISWIPQKTPEEDLFETRWENALIARKNLPPEAVAEFFETIDIVEGKDCQLVPSDQIDDDQRILGYNASNTVYMGPDGFDFSDNADTDYANDSSDSEDENGKKVIDRTLRASQRAHD